MGWFDYFKRPRPVQGELGPRPLQRATPRLNAPQPFGEIGPVHDAVIVPSLSGETSTAAADPAELRKMLLDAAASGDEDRLACLCRENEALILQLGPGWLDVPREFRANPAAAEWYGAGLRAIVEFCARHLRRPELLEHLSPADAEPARRPGPMRLEPVAH